MALFAIVSNAASAWSTLYSDHESISVSIKYLHIAATMVGGGLAISLDRQMFTAVRAAGEARAVALEKLRGAHRTVIPALVVATISGLLMMAADLNTFLTSSLFWVKIAFFAALLINGGILQFAENAALRNDPTA